MKTILVFSILFSVSIALPVRAELTETDLENIRQIFREEWEKQIREEWEKPIIDHIDTSFDSIHRNLDRIQMMLWIAIFVVGVAGSVNWMSILI